MASNHEITPKTTVPTFIYTSFTFIPENMTDMTQKEVFDFKRKLERIRDFKGRATELITLYIPHDKLISDVAAYLRNEYSQSSNIKSKSTRKNVTAAIESIMARLKYFKEAPENGLVFLVGHVDVGSDQTSMVQEVLEPPSPITIFLYRCDSEFFLEPLEDLVKDKRSYGLVVIDRNEATIGLIKGKRIQVVKNLLSHVMGKHSKGGQSAQRFERLIEISVHEFFKKVGDIANDTFLGEEQLEGVLVGGPGATKRDFTEKDYLHHEIKKKILGLVDTGYTDEFGLKELMENSSDMLSQIDLMKEKQLMQRFFREIRGTKNLFAYGKEDVQKALEMGAIDTLLISEDFVKYELELKCTQCGWKGIIHSMNEEERECKECGEECNLIAKRDLIDEYYLMAEGVSTEVTLISTSSEEGHMLKRAFGGIAAILRYPIC